MKLAKFFLAVGIAIVFTVFITYGLYAVYDKPAAGLGFSNGSSSCYKNYPCSTQLQNCYNTDVPTPDTDLIGACKQKVQESVEYQSCMKLQKECNETWSKTTPAYKFARNNFYILGVIGFAAIIGGILLTGVEAIGSGFIGGGILVVIWSLIYTHDYWLNFNKFVKVGFLGVVLIALIILGYKKIEDKFTKK